MDYIHESLRPLAVPIDSLNPDPRNARTHPDGNLQAIQRSLSQFGQRKPIVVQRQGMIIRAGNGTLTAAKALGWTHLAAVVVDESDVQAAAYAIADNRSAELAEWDEALLLEILQEIHLDESIEVDVTGFDIDSLATTEPTPPDGFPEVGEGISTEFKCPKCAYEWSGKPK